MIKINNLCDKEYRTLRTYLHGCRLLDDDKNVVSSCETRLVQLLTAYPLVSIEDVIFLRLILGADGCKRIANGVPGWYKVERDGECVTFKFIRDKDRLCKSCLLMEEVF